MRVRKRRTSREELITRDEREEEREASVAAGAGVEGRGMVGVEE